MNQATTYFPTHLRAVSSASKDLTSGFGMVPGVAPSVLPPEFRKHSNNFIKFVNKGIKKKSRIQGIAAPSARDDINDFNRPAIKLEFTGISKGCPGG